MKPTVPMSAFPGGPPGGGGFGSQPGGGGGGEAPPGAEWRGSPNTTPAPPKKSRKGLFIGLGCGCLVVLGCLVGLVAMVGLVGTLAPGEEVASTTVTFGQLFVLTYEQSGSYKYDAWLELDLEFSQGYELTGTVLLSESEVPFEQYTLREDGFASPVVERRSSKRINWRITRDSELGRVSGKASLFPISARAAGSRVSLSGTIEARPGTTGTIRLFVTKRK